MQLILATLALLLIAKAFFQLSRERVPSPDTFTSGVWGAVLLLGAIEFLRYSDLTIKGVLVLMCFVLLLSLLFLLLPKAQIARFQGNPTPSHSLLQLARIVSVLVTIGIGLRYYHSVVIYQRPLFDVQQSYQITASEVMPGTWYSRFATILFLWPLPAAVLSWHAVQLRWWDRALFFVGSMGHAAFGLLQGGRSGLLITLCYMIPLVWLSLVAGPASVASKRKRAAFMTGAGFFVVASAMLLLVMFGLRTSDELGGGRYSRVMDVNPRYAQLVDPFNASILQEGLLGAVGYGTQPAQRLSLFFELGLDDDRFYGAWNFDLAANILRRIGIGTEHYAESMSRVYSTYAEQGVPPGTFSTCIRDFYLDFGWPGVFIGGVAMVVFAQFFYRKVVSAGRWDLLPMLGVAYALLGISPLFSGLQVGGANLTLCGAIASCILLRFAARSSVPARLPQLRPNVAQRAPR